MTPHPCPKCNSTPHIETVDRIIGRLYRIHCCGMIAFGDPISKPARMREYMVALQSAYARWNKAVNEVKG